MARIDGVDRNDQFLYLMKQLGDIEDALNTLAEMLAELLAPKPAPKVDIEQYLDAGEAQGYLFTDWTGPAFPKSSMDPK